MVRCRIWVRILGGVGLGCLAATFLLIPMGVQVVRAEDGVPVRMSVEPEPVADERALTENPVAPPVLPVIQVGDGPEALRPGIAGIEIAPGVIVLNTNGYNYPTAPGGVDPVAMEFESKTPSP